MLYKKKTYSVVLEISANKKYNHFMSCFHYFVTKFFTADGSKRFLAWTPLPLVHV